MARDLAVLLDQIGARQVDLAGQLSDQAGACSIVNADEWIVAQVQVSFFADGREFVYIEHHPQTVMGQPEPTFDLVKLERRRRASPPGLEIRVWPAED